jgi:hypothetical protein
MLGTILEAIHSHAEVQRKYYAERRVLDALKVDRGHYANILLSESLRHMHYKDIDSLV